MIYENKFKIKKIRMEMKGEKKRKRKGENTKK